LRQERRNLASIRVFNQAYFVTNSRIFSFVAAPRSISAAMRPLLSAHLDGLPTDTLIEIWFQML
jgi:hypothetical protein